jgi:5-formyltetrahydrofolate cyclo-ligase
MTKKEIRKLYKEQRQNIPERDLLRYDDLLLIRFQQWPLQDFNVLLSYFPIQNKAEINTHLMADYLAFRLPHLQLAFPVMDPVSHLLKPMLVHDDTDYRENNYGIAEPVNGTPIRPSDIDLVFVPLLAFDERGYRVGYGKGYYDRFLSACRKDVVKIGFSYFEPLPRIDDINEFDVPLSLCITPNKLYEF